MSPLVISSSHGHVLTIPNPPRNPPLDHVTFTSNSISIPSKSPLNLPACITLCLPSPPTLHLAKQWCRTNLTQFISLHQNRLTFSVSHFSRYKYEEDSDEESTIASPETKTTPKPVQPPVQSPAETLSNASHLNISPRRAIGIGDVLDDEEDAIPPPPLKQEMQSSLIKSHLPTEPEESSLEIDSAWALADTERWAHTREALFGEPESLDSDHIMQDVDEAIDSVPLQNLRLNDAAEDEPIEETDKTPAENGWIVKSSGKDGLFPLRVLPHLSLQRSIVFGREGCMYDLGLMMGRYRRVSFTPHGFMASPRYGEGGSTSDPFSLPGFHVELENVWEGVERETAKTLLRVHCEAWYRGGQNGDDEHNQDRLKRPQLRGLFESVGDSANLTVQSFVDELRKCCEMGDFNANHAHIAMWMVQALFKRELGKSDDSEANLLQRLTAWAQGPAGMIFDEKRNSKADGLRMALVHMSLGKIEEAIDVAIEAGHARLGLMIARSLELKARQELQDDARSQLERYGLIGDLHEERETEGDLNDEQWDSILQGCGSDEAVCVDERMILMVLCGKVAPVARFLNLSWYRLFILELFHGVGVGSADLSQGERVCVAVDAIENCGLGTEAPHGQGGYTDVVYHLLRLYADANACYPLTSGVYSAGSFGHRYAPLDGRFSWLLYQTLSGLVGAAGMWDANVRLCDAFSAQLCSLGMYAWGLYVRCCGGTDEEVVKSELIRHWDGLSKDYVEWKPYGEKGSMNAESFLVDILNIPKEWVSEAKAWAAERDGEFGKACEHWVEAKGMERAHELVTKVVFPGIVGRKEVEEECDGMVNLLRRMKEGRVVAEWGTGGGLILDFLENVVRGGTNDIEVLRRMVGRVTRMRERIRARDGGIEEMVMVKVMAEGIAGAERAIVLGMEEGEERSIILEMAVEDLGELWGGGGAGAIGKGVEMRIAGELRSECEHGERRAARLAAAMINYRR